MKRFIEREDRRQVAQAAEQEMQLTGLQAFADRGYFSGAELKACEDAGIETFLPKPVPVRGNWDWRCTAKCIRNASTSSCHISAGWRTP